jgi:hypothetical protein
MTSTDTKPSKKKRITSQYPDLYIPLGEFDRSNLIIQAPRKSGSQGAIKSRYLYRSKDEAGNEILCTPCVCLEGQSCYINTVHPYDPDKNKDKNKAVAGAQAQDAPKKDLVGYQITYPITSWETRDAPTAEELESKKVFDGVVLTMKEQIPRFANITYPGTDELVFNSTTLRMNLRNLDDTKIKPVYSYPILKDTAGVKVTEKVIASDGAQGTRPKLDTTKSQSGYFKMITFGKNEELEIKSSLYDPEYDPSQDTNGTKGLLNIATLAGKRGFIDQPTFKLVDVYYSQSGTETDNVVFPQIKFHAGIFEEIEISSTNFRDKMFAKRNAEDTSPENHGVSSREPAPVAKGGKLAELFNGYSAEGGHELLSNGDVDEAPPAPVDRDLEEHNKKKAAAAQARKIAAGGVKPAPVKAAPAKKN